MAFDPVPRASTQATAKVRFVREKNTSKVAEALWGHQKTLDHQPVLCSKCNMAFGTQNGMKAHKRTCRKPTKPTSTAQPQVQKQQQMLGEVFLLASLPPGSRYDGHTFALLDTLEQDLVFIYLLARCHSFERLQSQKYTLPATAAANNVKAAHSGIKRAEFRELPKASSTPQHHQKRRAIAIDCEMVEVAGGQRELALLTAVDFLTGEVLINQYVKPTIRVTNWISNISGVTRAAMEAAVAAGQALFGWKAARQALWEFASDQTVLIGQSLNNDLNVLGTFPGRVVDSAILTSEAVFPLVPSTCPLTRMWSLKTLAKDLLGYEIQTGNKGHNCLEDTMSTREVVIRCLWNPGQLKMWAGNALAQHEAINKKKKKKRGPAKRFGQGVTSSFSFEYVSEDDEILRWSDIAEDCGWPHPDTGYDPWSD